MEKQDWQRFTKLMIMAAELTAGKPLSQDAMGMMFKILQRFEFDRIYTAVMNTVESSGFMPKVADIVKFLEGTPEERSSVAWAKVLKALSTHGTYKSVQFDDPHIHYAIQRMGGWILLGQSDEEQMRFLTRDFDRYYTESIHRGLTWDSPDIQKTMMGLTDSHAVRQGLELSAPIKPHEVVAPVEVPQIEAPKSEGKLIPVKIEYGKLVRGIV